MEIIKENILVTSDVQKESVRHEKCTSQRKRLVNLTINQVTTITRDTRRVYIYLAHTIIQRVRKDMFEEGMFGFRSETCGWNERCFVEVSSIRGRTEQASANQRAARPQSTQQSLGGGVDEGEDSSPSTPGSAVCINVYIQSCSGRCPPQQPHHHQGFRDPNTLEGC